MNPLPGRLTIAAAMLLLAAAAAVMTMARRRDDARDLQLQIMVQMDELENGLAVMQNAAGADEQLVASHAAHVQVRVDAIARSFTAIPSAGTEVREALNAMQRQVHGLGAAIRLSDPAARANAVSAQSAAAIGAVNKFNAALARYYARTASAHDALASRIEAFIGVLTLLLVILLAMQMRSARSRYRLYSELHALMEGTPQVLLSVDAHGMPRRWNDRLLRAAGLTAQQLRSRRVIDLFAPEDRPAAVQAIDAALTQGQSECELPLRRGSESIDYAWVLCRDAADAGAGLMVIGRDVSDRSSTERELRESETRYRHLFEQVGDAVYSTAHGRLVEVNRAASQLVGYSREELIGKPVVELYEDPNDRAALLKAIARSGSVSDYPVRFRHKNGSVLDCVATCAIRRNERGRPIGLHGIVRDVSERKRFETELQRSEREYRGLFENALDAIIIIDPFTEEVLDANARACAMYGFEHDDLVGRSMITLSVDPARGRDYGAQTIRGTGRYLPFEPKHYRSDGTIIDVEIKAALVSYQNRSAILSINRDVTERREAERKVRESEERFRLLLENVTDHAIYMLDPEGRVVSWNEGAERITGFSAEEITGRSFAMLYAPEQSPQRHLETAAMTGRSEHEDLLVRKDGRRAHVAVTLSRIIDDGILRGFALVTRDITDRKQWEDTQRELLAGVQNVATEWTKTFDAVSVPILLVDQEGFIRRANEAAQRLSGLQYPSLIQKPTSELPGEPWVTIARVVDFYQQHATVTDARADDPVTRRSFEVVSTAIDLDGEKRLIIALHELTLLRQLEESLRQTEITAALGAVVAGVAHEVRNPLFTISATLDSWEARMGETPQSRRYLDPLRQEIDRLNTLMSELLDYGKPHQLHLTRVSMLSVIRAAAAQNRVSISRAGVEVVIDAAEDLEAVDVDEGKMQQVFRNLIENAVQHSPKDGVVRVVIREVEWATVVEVIDQGPGLSPADFTRAFVPFYTRRKGGTGLGLPIVRKIVLAHGGEIVLRNGDGGGTVATVRVLRSAAALARSVRAS